MSRALHLFFALSMTPSLAWGACPGAVELEAPEPVRSALDDALAATGVVVLPAEAACEGVRARVSPDWTVQLTTADGHAASRALSGPEEVAVWLESWVRDDRLEQLVPVPQKPAGIYAFRTLEDLRAGRSEGPFDVALLERKGKLGSYRVWDNTLKEGRAYGPMVAFTDGQTVWFNHDRPRPRRAARYGALSRVGDEAVYQDYQCSWRNTGKSSWMQCDDVLRHIDLATGKHTILDRGRLRRILEDAGATELLAAFLATRPKSPEVIRATWLDFARSSEQGG